MRATALRRERWDPLAIDGHTADRLLLGMLEPADAPPRYRHVASAIQHLRKDATPDERAGGSTAVASMVAELASIDTDEAPDAIPSVRRGSGRLKTIALGCVASLSLTTGLGIAGALPDGPQALVASVLNGVGVGAPTPGSSSPARPNPRSSSAPGRSVDPAVGAPIREDPPTTSTPTTTAPAAGPEAGAPVGGPGGGSGGGSGGGAPTSGGPGGGSGNAGGNGHGNAGGNGNGNAGGNGHGNAGGNGHGNAGGNGNGNAGGNGNGNAGGNGNGHGH